MDVEAEVMFAAREAAASLGNAAGKLFEVNVYAGRYDRAPLLDEAEAARILELHMRRLLARFDIKA